MIITYSLESQPLKTHEYVEVHLDKNSPTVQLKQTEKVTNSDFILLFSELLQLFIQDRDLTIKTSKKILHTFRIASQPELIEGGTCLKFDVKPVKPPHERDIDLLLQMKGVCEELKALTAKLEVTEDVSLLRRIQSFERDLVNLEKPLKLM